MRAFPPPYNPDKLDPVPGYRFLGKDETLKTTDEWTRGAMNGTKRCWESTGFAEGKSIAQLNTTYRRALNVDDSYAPPPDQWVIPGWRVEQNPIDPETYRGKKGDEYWSPSSRSWWTVNEGEKFFSPAYIRYRTPSVQSYPSMNSSTSSSVKPVLKPDQSIVIDIHGNSILSRAVQEAAFAAGWSWNEWGKMFYSNTFDAIRLDITKRLSAVASDWYREHEKTALFLDARTDLGVLIDLLAASVVNPPKIDGGDGKVYEGKFAKGDVVVEFGCARISINLLKRAKEMIDLGYYGNRTVQSIVLSSGVSINREEISDILTYVEAIDKG